MPSIAARIEPAQDLGGDRPARARGSGFRLPSLRPPARALAYLEAVAIVALATGVAELFRDFLNTSRHSMIFMAAVLVAGLRRGTSPAVTAAALSWVIYVGYLSHPRMSLHLASVGDAVTAVIFLAVATLTGVLAGRVRDDALVSKSRARTMAALFQASRELSSAGEEERLRQSLADLIADAAKGEACILDGPLMWRAPPYGPSSGLQLRLIGASLADATGSLRSPPGWHLRRLRTGEIDLGLAIWRHGASDPAPDESSGLIDILVDLGAAAIARARLSSERSEVQARAGAEQLRAALLSSISHDLRTPLASILASVTSLKEFGPEIPANSREDLLLTIEEEAERLNRFVVNLLNMTKLESGALSIERTATDAVEVLDEIADRYRRRTGTKAIASITDISGATVMADPLLLEQALSNLVENAIRFSPKANSVALTAARQGELVSIEVEDHGPGVSESERERIFEKFYRVGSGPARRQGAGLGLSITKGLIEAMGGTVAAQGRHDGASGLRIVIQLPGADA